MGAKALWRVLGVGGGVELDIAQMIGGEGNLEERADIVAGKLLAGGAAGFGFSAAGVDHPGGYLVVVNAVGDLELVITLPIIFGDELPGDGAGGTCWQDDRFGWRRWVSRLGW